MGRERTHTIHVEGKVQESRTVCWLPWILPGPTLHLLKVLAAHSSQLSLLKIAFIQMSHLTWKPIGLFRG